MKIAVIPARLGSQRMKRKNLGVLHGAPLIAHAVRKCIKADVFDEIWVNSEADEIGEVALAEGAGFHKRPPELADNIATSEQFTYEFLKCHPCEYLFQVHSIAPLLTAEEVRAFVGRMTKSDCDVLLSCTLEQIECAMSDMPVNFTFDEKTNSQELDPIQRVTWSITAWRPATFIPVYEAGKTATYAGKIGFFPVGRLAGHIIKTEDDFRIAEALFELVHGSS